MSPLKAAGALPPHPRRGLVPGPRFFVDYYCIKEVVK